LLALLATTDAMLIMTQLDRFAEFERNPILDLSGEIGERAKVHGAKPGRKLAPH
jgi:hypothetical protein